MKPNSLKKLASLALTLAVFLSLLPAVTLQASAAGTSLSAGDIAFIAVNSDGDDDFSFVLLKDVVAGTSFYITDKGWNDGTGFYVVTGDGIWQWTTASSLNAGTVVHVKTSDDGIVSEESLFASPGTIARTTGYTYNNMTVSYAGDQLFIYQGTEDSPTFITGIHWNVETGTTDAANWDGAAAAATTSALPDTLTNGINAIWVYGAGPTEYDNFRYKTTAASAGTPAELNAAINNIANWDVDETNATAYTTFAGPFTVNIPAAAPTVTTQAATAITQTTATGNGNITDLGSPDPTQYGVVWDTSADPTVALTTKAEEGAASATGAFTSGITGLTAGTTYHVRAYATNTAGTSYGADVTFTTTAELYWKDYAAAGYDGGSGTGTDPYLISTAEQLAYLSNAVNAGTVYSEVYFKQTADINLTGKLWTRIGDPVTNKFAGTYDGDGHKITNLAITAPATGYGLFGGVTGTVKNLGIIGASINAGSYATQGVLSAALLTGGMVENCYTTGNLSGSAGTYGGLIGNLNGGTVSRCYSEVNVTSTTSSSTQSAGGLVGNAATGTIVNCYAKGSVTNNTGRAGGLIGLTGSANTPAITNCYSKGAVTGAVAGGFVGYYSLGTFTGCFFDQTTSGKTDAYGASVSSGPAGITGEPTSEMKTAATFTDASWSASVWYLADGSYPELLWQFTAPTAATDSASGVTSTTATLGGTVNDNGTATTVTFEYGLTTGYGSTATAAQSPVGAGTGSTSVSAALGGLASGTTYHFRVNATNAAGTTYGSDNTFTTSAPAPTVTEISPTSGTTTGGTSVTITGTSFTGATAVKFGTTDAASFSVDSATQITAVSPAGSAGTADIAVTTPGGTGTGTGLFTYLENTAPTAGFGKALEFNGTDEKIVVPYNTGLNFSGASNMTISMWFNQKTAQASVLYNMDSQNGEFKMYIYLYADGHLLVACNKQGSDWQTNAGTVISLNQWHHFSFTKSGTQVTAYVDGEEYLTMTLNATTASAAANSRSVYFGGKNSDFLGGYLDEIQVFSTALTQTTIQNWMYREIDSSHPNYSSLVLHYSFNDANASAATDTTGVNNGEISNMDASNYVDSTVRDWTTAEDTAVFGHLIGSDADGDALTYEIAANGAKGTAAVTAGTNQFTYTPGANLNGSDSFTYKVTDAHGAESAAQTVSLSITAVNDAPMDISLSGGSVAENSASGTSVGTLSATDPDSGDTFTYALVAGTGADDNASFTLFGNTLKTNAAFDYETKSSCTVRIRATDAGGLSYEKTFTVTVTDVTAPTVTDGHISIGGATGISGAYKIGDTVTATWDNTASGDNNGGVTGVTVDFSQFGGGGTVSATDSSGIWTAACTITSGSIEASIRNVSVTATNAEGSATAADTTNAAVDNKAPTASITSSASNPTNASPIPVTVTFSESVTGFALGDITVVNGTAGNLAGSGTTYTADITPSGDGAVTVNVAANVSADAAGNGNTAAAQLSVTFDGTAPFAPSEPDLTATSDTGASDTDNATYDTTPTFIGTAEANSAVTLYADSAVIGSESADGSGSWNITASALTDGTYIITARATDAAGNESAASGGLSVAIDTTAPTAGSSGTIAEGNITQNSIKLTWAAAADAFTAETGLQYKIIYSANNDIATVSDAESNGTVAANWTADINDYTVTGLTAATAYYFNVLVKDTAGNIEAYTAATATTGSASSGGGLSSGSTNNGAVLIVNGASQTAGTFKATTNSGGQTVTTVTVDSDKLENILASAGGGAPVIIPFTGDQDVASVVLTGAMVKYMQDNTATLIIRTGTGTYTIPASEIDIDAVSQQMGADISLSGITVTVSVAEPSAGMMQIIENAADDGGYTIMIPAVEYTITCTYNGQTVEVGSFSAYVERAIAIPDGVDPAQITTGVVVDPGGTVRHVPTKVTFIDGVYYAVIKSLTDSVYSVVWNPVVFSDVTGHWAGDTINDMASRMIVTGVGNNMYEPDRSMTRAEFATIIVRALGLEPGAGASGFNDVAVTAWYCGYVETAASYGIIKGYPDGGLGPNDTITREQAMTMIARATAITGLGANLTDAEVNQLLAGFSDKASVSAYAKSSTAACLKTGIVFGKSGDMIAPRDSITRSEVAVMIQRLLRKSDLI